MKWCQLWMDTLICRCTDYPLNFWWCWQDFSCCYLLTSHSMLSSGRKQPWPASIPWNCCTEPDASTAAQQIGPAKWKSLWILEIVGEFLCKGVYVSHKGSLEISRKSHARCILHHCFIVLLLCIESLHRNCRCVEWTSEWSPVLQVWIMHRLSNDI